MENKKIERCPFCGGENFAVGYQSGDGAISTTDGERTCRIMHLFCLECGAIVKSKVENPDIFKERDDGITLNII